MHKIAAWALTLAFVVPATAADQAFDPEARAKVVAPYLDAQTVGVYHLDVTRLDPGAIVAKLGGIEKMPDRVKAEAEQVLVKWVGSFKKAGGKDLYLVISLADVPQNPPFVIVPLQGDADATEIMELLGPGKPADGDKETHRLPMPFAVQEKLDHVVFAGSKATRKRLRLLKPSPRPELAKAFAAVGDTTAQVVILPTADIRRIIEEQIPTLPKVLGGEPSTVVTHGVMWLAVGADPPPKLALHGVIQSHDAQAAKALDQLIATALKALTEHKEIGGMIPGLDQLVAGFKPEIKDDRLTFHLDDKTLTAALVPSVLRVRQAADRMRSANNLRQIGLALHTYHDVHKTFPAAFSTDQDGKPLLSWRVHVLPYLEQDQLYKQFHLDEAWDSPHNKKLIARIPEVYQSTPQARLGALRLGLDAGKTTYLGITGDGTMFPGRKPVAIREVTDGTSKTIFVVEASDKHAVVWTKPGDYEYDPDKPTAGLVGHSPGGFLALFVDGSVRTLLNDIDPKTLAALFTRNGGEAVNVP